MVDRLLAVQQGEQREIAEQILILGEFREQVGRPQPATVRGDHRLAVINGRKRFIVTDTFGLLAVVCVMAASWQNRDG